MNALQLSAPPEIESKLTSKRDMILKRAAEIDIETEEDCQAAVDFVKSIKTQSKMAEEERRKLTDPINGAVANINQRFKTITGPLAEAERIVKEKILAYQQLQAALLREKQEAERIEREEAARKAEEQVKANMAMEVAAGGVSDAPDRSLAPPDDHILQPHDLTITAPKADVVRVRGESGALATTKKVWKYRVINILQLAEFHPEAVQANHEAIMHCIKNGVRAMPGLEIYQEDQLQIR